MAKNKKRARRNGKRISNDVVKRNNALPMQLAPSFTTRAVPTASRRSRFTIPRGVKLSREGVEFLKAVIAPRDFPGLVPSGVPDRFGGKSFVMNHSVVTTFTTTAATNCHIMLMPTLPGALWTLSTNAIDQTSNWTSTNFVNVDSQIFGYTASTAASATAPFIAGFRVLGGSIEVLPQTAPAATPNVVYVGRQVVGITQVGAVTVPVGMGGCALGVITGSGAYYSGPLASGVYATMVCHDPVWVFRDPLMGNAKMPSASPTDDGTLNNEVLGFDETMTAVAMCIPAYSATQALLISVTMTVEYMPATSTLLEQVAKQAPFHDAVALQLYEMYTRDMPIAVPAYNNVGFWKLFLSALSAAGVAIGALMPGPVGGIVSLGGQAAGALANYIE